MDSITPLSPMRIVLGVVMWMVWMSMISGIFLIRFFAIPPRTEEQLAEPLQISMFFVIGLIPALIGLAIRFLLIPRIRMPIVWLPCMIGGLMLCQSPGMIGNFVTRNVGESAIMFVIAVVCTGLSVPIYAFSRPKPPKLSAK